jgi:hypothetical protein
MISLILLIVALVLFILAGFNVTTPRFNPVGLGLAAWVLAEIVGSWP